MADLFRKTKSNYSSTTNSFGTGTGETITPNSVTGLPTDTEITLTFDRVDSNGTATPNSMERIIGTISGGNFVVRTSPSSGRGADGSTEQAHTSPVVEYIPNAKDINDMVDGIVAEHSQAGAHTAASATAAGVVELATTAETTTGTDATRAVTPDGLHDMTSLSGAAWMLDEDDMTSNSATKVPSQQSVKAYVDGSVTTTAADSSITPTGDYKRNELYATALSGTTNILAPSGTPTNGNILLMRIEDSGSSRALSFASAYQEKGATIPASTTAGKTHYIGFLYNSTDSKWDCIAAVEEA